MIHTMKSCKVFILTVICVLALSSCKQTRNESKPMCASLSVPDVSQASMSIPQEFWKTFSDYRKDNHHSPDESYYLFRTEQAIDRNTEAIHRLCDMLEQKNTKDSISKY